MYTRSVVLSLLLALTVLHMTSLVDAAKISKKVDSARRKAPATQGKQARGMGDRMAGGKDIKTAEYNYLALVQGIPAANASDISISTGILITSNAVLTHGYYHLNAKGVPLAHNKTFHIFVGINKLRMKNATDCAYEDSTCQVRPWDKERGIVTGKKQIKNKDEQLILIYIKYSFCFADAFATAMMARGARFPQMMNQKCQLVAFNWMGNKSVQMVGVELTAKHYSTCELNMSDEELELYDDRICTTGHRLENTTLVGPGLEDIGAVLVCEKVVAGMFLGYISANSENKHEVLAKHNVGDNDNSALPDAFEQLTPVYQFVGSELPWIFETIYTRELNDKGTVEIADVDPIHKPLS